MAKHHCYQAPTITKKTVIAAFEEGGTTRSWLESLSDDQWDVTSFDAKSRLVCAEVVGAGGRVTYLAITLPDLRSGRVG